MFSAVGIRWKMISLRPGPGGVCASAKGLTLDERRRRDPDRFACPLRARHGYIPHFGEPETAGNPGVDARFLLRTWNRHTGLLSVRPEPEGLQQGEQAPPAGSRGECSSRSVAILSRQDEVIT